MASVLDILFFPSYSSGNALLFLFENSPLTSVETVFTTCVCIFKGFGSLKSKKKTYAQTSIEKTQQNAVKIRFPVNVVTAAQMKLNINAVNAYKPLKTEKGSELLSNSKPNIT